MNEIKCRNRDIYSKSKDVIAKGKKIVTIEIIVVSS